MKKIKISFLMALTFSLCASAWAAETRLDEPQQKALQHDFPNSKILSTCTGNYSGNSSNELVLSVTSDSYTASPAISRVGLTFSNNQWTVHHIDDELKKDLAISHSSPLEKWDPSTDTEKFARAVKCNVTLKSDKTFSMKGKLFGRAPFFSVPKIQKGSAANTCFGSSAEYNNWDCVAYDPQQRRFRLWYQQVFAD